MSEASIAKLKHISETFDAIVSIERPSITAEGKYMTMRAIDITHLCAQVDKYLFPQVGQAKFNKDQTLISVGDGGNEVGMGKVQHLVRAHIPNGEKISTNTVCDYLIVADTSNFGAYALVMSIVIELLELEKKNKEAFLNMFPEMLKVTLGSLVNH